MRSIQQLIFDLAADVADTAMHPSTHPELGLVDVIRLVLASVMLWAAAVFLGDYEPVPEA